MKINDAFIEAVKRAFYIHGFIDVKVCEYIAKDTKQRVIYILGHHARDDKRKASLDINVDENEIILTVINSLTAAAGIVKEIVSSNDTFEQICAMLDICEYAASVPGMPEEIKSELAEF